MSDSGGNALGWAGLIAGATALLGSLLPYLKRKDERVDRVQDDRNKMRASLDERQVKELDRMENKILRLEKRELELEAHIRAREAEHAAQIDALEQDRDRGWDLARLWRRFAERVLHRWANKVTALNGYIEAGAIPGAVIEATIPFPKMDEITQKDVEI